MKFFGMGQVWDKKNNKIMCSFKGAGYDGSGYAVPGEYETKDEYEIKVLKERGYFTDFEAARKKLREKKNTEIKDNKIKAKSLKSESDILKEK